MMIVFKLWNCERERESPKKTHNEGHIPNLDFSLSLLLRSHIVHLHNILMSETSYVFLCKKEKLTLNGIGGLKNVKD